MQVFEEEASSWDGKLNAVNNIFDIWFNVQRKWVYLDGIFSGSADIKHLLPTETSKFASYASLQILCCYCSSFFSLVFTPMSLPTVLLTVFYGTLFVTLYPSPCRVSQEFIGLMKQVAKAPLVMTVIAIPNVQKSLERLADLLVKIEKVLLH